ncbi:uncharacterized protein [Palaemon carinicauda]|uniref:uncharacterized protein n=1 Tax=Palaemon carinicauda TaxID=392227 RepID=UPI0035B5A476
MAKSSTDAWAQALLSSWVSHFGVPEDMTTDRGPAFISDLWASFSCLMGTNLHSTVAYNLAANAPRSDGDTSPAEKVYGKTLVVPGEFFPAKPGYDDVSTAPLHQKVEKFMPFRKMYRDRTKHYRPTALNTCPYVFTALQ